MYVDILHAGILHVCIDTLHVCIDILHVDILHAGIFACLHWHTACWHIACRHFCMFALTYCMPAHCMFALTYCMPSYCIDIWHVGLYTLLDDIHLCIVHTSWHTHVVSWHGIDACRISALLTHTTPHKKPYLVIGVTSWAPSACVLCTPYATQSVISIFSSLLYKQ